MKLIDLLEQARDVINENGNFKMNYWHSGYFEGDVNIKECGTAYSIGGWMVALLGDNMYGVQHIHYCSNLQDDYHLDDLFNVSNWHEFLDSNDYDKLIGEVEAYSEHKDRILVSDPTFLSVNFDNLPDDKRAYWGVIAINSYIDVYVDYLDKEVTLEGLK